MANITLRRGSGQSSPAASPSSSVPSVFGRWDPFRLMDDFFRWDPFREMMPSAGASNLAFVPDFDVTETQDSYIFKADLPGMKESEVQIAVDGNRLTVSGTREQEQREDHLNYFVFERAYGNFTRSFTLPQGADTGQIQADLKDGVLTVTVAKSPESKPRKISINPGSPESAGSPSGKPTKQSAGPS